jgi:phosphatidylglycerol:prolipoprotein diacylglycerol transferase
MIDFPNINPVIFSVGPLAVSWYSLSYIVGILLGWYYANKLILLYPIGISRQHTEDFISWAIIAIIIGGRLGHVLFYDPEKYLSNPIEILKTYEGGMSFHGGIFGVGVAAYLYCKKNQIRFLSFSDVLAIVAPIGLFLGRIANFINAELYGRQTNVPWAVIFPHSDGFPRHPSQLYEALLEGLFLFCIMLYFTYKSKFLLNPGRMSGIFLIFYGSFRVLVEFFREPDVKIGFIFKYFTLGQILCIPMILLGAYLWNHSTKNTIKNGDRLKNKVNN